MKYPFLLLILLSIFSCQENEISDWEEIDLLSNGMPIKVYAPPGVTVKASNLLFDKDIVISNGEDYNLQIFMSESYNSNLSERVEEEKENVSEMKFFSKIMEEFPEGFIFELALDSTSTSHDFRYIEIKGDKEYILQMGLGTLANLNTVKATIDGIKASRAE